MNRLRSRPSAGRIAASTLETLAWVGLATALVAILHSVATPAGKFTGTPIFRAVATPVEIGILNRFAVPLPDAIESTT